MSWDIKGTTGSLDALQNVTYQSKVNAPRNPKLIKEAKKSRKLRPSDFLREMNMDTKEKLATTHEMYLPKIVELLDMGETSLQKNSQLTVDEPMFQPYPSEIFFQKYKAFNTYEVPLLLRNNDKVPRLVRVTQTDTPYFKIVSPIDAHQKVGPGLPIIFKIQFTPEETKDYNHELIVSTEREKFLVPIKCIGARAILDFSDEIFFPISAVKNLNSKDVLVRNIGDKDAIFSLEVEKPFSISPAHGILPIRESMQVTIEFQPMKCGDHKKELAIIYDTGEIINVSLFGSAQDINVRLDKNSLRIEDTYITMSNQRTVTIHNRGDIIVQYEWKKYATIEEEEQQKLKEITNLNRDEDNLIQKMTESKKLAQNTDYIALLSRNFQNKIKNTQKKSFQFDDDVFFIQPIKGEIWPNTSVDVEIIFKPDYAQTYNRILFCDITGRESRLPLRLTGVGIGPKVALSIETLDVGSVFIGSTHVYEIVLSNKGFIDAIYSINIPNTTFGKCFSFEPNEGLISPNGFQAISVTFSSGTLGNFNEVFEFTIDGKPDKYKFLVSGSVIPPTFDFSIPKLKFGLVSYGFKYTQTCLLTNTSLVPMNFNLKVASDSQANFQDETISKSDIFARSSESFRSPTDKSTDLLPKYNFKEFAITPSSGILPPQSEIKLQIDFIPHFLKKYETSLTVDIDNVGNDLFNLPITARSSVPTINLLTSSIDMGRCFISYSYEKHIKLANESSLKARYILLTDKPNSPFKFSSNQIEGVVEANSTKDVLVYIEALQLGAIEDKLGIKINGSVEPVLQCQVNCLSQGPVVQINPKDIDWGLTTVLTDSIREILISNESLIEARYSVQMGRKNSPWRVEPAEGVVQPGTEITAKAICHLVDKIKYDDVININIEHSFTQLINVKAHGAGCSIVSEPSIGNMVNFGTYFSGGVVKRLVMLTNRSSRTQNLLFLLESKANMTHTSSKKEKEANKNKPPINTVFKITPNRVELYPNESKEIAIEGFSEKPQLAEEIYVCHSIIGKTSGKDRIMKFRIKCEFIAPLVSFSTRNLLFRCEHDGVSLPRRQTNVLTIANVSCLDLTAQFSTQKPFYIVDYETGDLISDLVSNLHTGESLQLTINFDTSFKQDLHNQTVNGGLNITYKEHQHNDLVNLTGEIYFPNVHLEKQYIDFGCILNNTEVQNHIKMTNIGPIIVHYKWRFVVEKNSIIANQYGVQGESALVGVDRQNSLNKSIAERSTEDVGDKLNAEGVDGENKLEELLAKPRTENDIPSIEEIFDISPLYGNLYPGETQNLTITYFGHKEIKSCVKAVCEIKNGPDYELVLKGEASILDYEISQRIINLGFIPYDEVCETSITIRNTGKVSVQFGVVNLVDEPQQGNAVEPERPVLIPSKGFIDAEKSIVITIRYLPAVPMPFEKKVLLQISHFSPEEITIKGEAGFADITLDLPRFENDFYNTLLKEAKNIVKNREDSQSNYAMYSSAAIENECQTEIDRLAIELYVKQNHQPSQSKKRSTNVVNSSEALESKILLNVPTIINQSDLPAENSSQEVDVKQVEVDVSNEKNKASDGFEDSKRSWKKSIEINDSSNGANSNSKTSVYSKKKSKPVLPDYILDFGHVILGTVKTHVIRASNMGRIAASFEIERQIYSKSGFMIDLEKVKNLPIEETVEFGVTFDPRGANLGLGPVEHVVPINILNGPILNLRLKANVTMPDLQISSDVVDFGEVKCGECRIITFQLHNHKEVRCDWSASYLPRRDEKFTPLHLKRKKKLDGELNKPRLFEIMPPSGTLLPNDKVNIQLKFMPSDEKNYEERVTIRMAQSSQRLMILCKGKGLEPRIEFSKNSLEFKPILPHSPGDEQEVKIVNPCPFPVEIYNLEFDKMYLEEEKILRIMRGYDEYNSILLPPRLAGEKLPHELYEFYDEQMKKLEEEEKKLKQSIAEPISENPINEAKESSASAQVGTQSQVGLEKEKSKSKIIEESNSKNSVASNSTVPVGEIEKNPVFNSIARYLGIDLSSEGRAARNRRGVSIIVHGPPLSGKSAVAVSLARYYEGALLNIDKIITDAMSNGTSQAAARVRHICAEIAAKNAEEVRAQEAAEAARLAALGNQAVPGAQQAGTGLSVEALAQHSINQGGATGSKKTSVAGDSHTNQKGKKGKADNNTADQSSTHPSTPPPLLGPISRKLSISTTQYNTDSGYMSTVLPEDLIVELLSERFQLSDCNKGIVIDGLDTLFAQNHLLAMTAVLKAFNNRRYIYCVTMKTDYQKYKENQAKAQEEKAKAKREKELLEQTFFEEMDEETYNKLPPEKIKEIDSKLIEAKRLRLKREAEEKAAEKERIERELAEQQARLEEEKKKKRKNTNQKDDKKSQAANAANQKSNSKEGGKEGKEKDKATGQNAAQAPANAAGHGPQGAHAVKESERPHTRNDSHEDPKKGGKQAQATTTAAPPAPALPAHEEEVIVPKVIDPEEEKRKEAEKLLQQKFKTFDVYIKDIMHLLDAWDRTQGNIFRQLSPSEKSEHDDHLMGRRTKKETKAKEKERKDKEKQEAEKKAAEQHQSVDLENPEEGQDINAQQSTHNVAVSGNPPDKEDGIGVPNILVDANNKSEIEEIHKHPKLPPLSEVLDGMGLGPKGPPIPPPATFAVVTYPNHRKAPPGSEFSHYIFVTNNENDPNLTSDEKYSKDSFNAESGEGEKTPDNTQSAKSKKSAKGTLSRSESRSETASRKPSGSGANADKAEKKRSESSRKMARDSSGQSPNRTGSSSMSGGAHRDENNPDGNMSIDGSTSEKPSQKLQRFRWIIPANGGELNLRLRFTSDECGQFDQTLNFEIGGTRRRYQLHCRGICTFPSISREPRIVFPSRKKCRENGETVSKKYILADDIYDFGPLLVGANRERIKDGKHPEFVETLNIMNTSPLEAEVCFCFLNDNAEKVESCFFIEPSEMKLEPNECRQLKLFAAPKDARKEPYEETLVCCIKENPEPITFRISCTGQKPELTLDKKEFNFKQVLLHRKDSQQIEMKNTTLIPVQWKLDGINQLGDEFVCNQTAGIIEPDKTFNLILHFRALKPLVITKKENKNLKLTVSPVTSNSPSSHDFLGVMENHQIAVFAEAYDVALEISLPKGTDGGLDFGTLRVGGQDPKITCNLKNKGKFPIKFNFLTTADDEDSREFIKSLVISPSSGELQSSSDRNSQQTMPVSFTISPKRELILKDAPILKCQIIEPNLKEEGSIIANIPIKVSIRALTIKYSLTPPAELNFGCLNVNSKRQERFIIENQGEVDFKFTIGKYDPTKVQANYMSSRRNHDTSSQMSHNKQRYSSQSHNRSSSLRHNYRDNAPGQGRFQVGPFTVVPATGIIVYTGFVAVSIEFAPEAPGKYEEEIFVDITDREFTKSPNGIVYRITGEACYPSIVNSLEIFEEHTIIPNITVLDPKVMAMGVYAEEENKFIFNNVIVGRTAKARFKFINNNKIAADVNVILKANSKSQRLLTDNSTFDVDPQRLQIAAHSFSYVTVSFTPQAISSYSAYLEATLENIPNSLKSKAIAFEINGEGNLPRFSVVKPTLRNKKGQFMMLFKRSVLNSVDRHFLILSNDGTLPAKINFFMYDPDNSFTVRPSEQTKSKQNMSVGITYKDNILSTSAVKDDNYVIASIIVQPGSQASFVVSFTPKNVQTYQASLQLTVTDNLFEDTLIQMIGEGYMEDVILENLPDYSGVYEAPAVTAASADEPEEVVGDEEVAALKSNLIKFGDIYVNEAKQIIITMKNTSKTDCYRFEWPLHPASAQHAALSTSSNPSIQDKNQSQEPGSAGPHASMAATPIVTFTPRIGHLHAGCVKDITIKFKSGEPKFFSKELFNCILSKVTFDQPINEVKDWDDRMTIIKWVNEYVHVNPTAVPPSGPSAAPSNEQILLRQLSELSTNLPGTVPPSVAGTNSLVQPLPTKQIVRKKVVEIEPEPRHTRLDDHIQPIELFISANCDYSRFRCKTNAIRFKDTLMFQTRVFEVSVTNRGKTQFDYDWKIHMEDSRRPFTPMIEPESITPEQQVSPRGRGANKPSRVSNNSGANMDASTSPSRKTASQASGTKEKKGQGSLAGTKKSSTSKENLEDTVKSTKGGKGTSKNKDKDAKNPNQSFSSETDPNAAALDGNELNYRLNEEASGLKYDSSNQLRADSSLSYHPPSTIIETGYIPFSVEPALGKLEPGKTQVFKVKFSPLNVNDYQARLVCNIPNVEDGKPGAVVMVKGRGLLPYCHFELEESDYITSGRRNPDLPGPVGTACGLGLDPMIKVLEFTCVGLAAKVVRKFEIVNPTNIDYDFEWIKQEQNDVKKYNQFTCLQPHGKLISGKRYEIAFEFVPNEISVQENFWRFRIPQFDLSIPFLLVGIVTEPKVIFDKSHVSFKPLLVGYTGRESVNLINQESEPIDFEFDQTSCYTEGRSEVVLVDPAAGVIQPKSTLPIHLSFQPKEQAASIFNLKCKLLNSQKPLNLNVKCVGFAIHTNLICEDINSGAKHDFSESTMNEIHMGEVEKNETCFRNLYVVNTGKHKVAYEWLISGHSEETTDCFSIDPPVGSVEVGEKKLCVLRYVAKSETISAIKLILKIENGATYRIYVDGIAVKPDLNFSFSAYDFGPCFVYKAGMRLKTVPLTLTNRGRKDLNVSSLFDGANSVFQLDFKQAIIAPGKSASAVITFIPREFKQYEEKFVFELNGLTRREVYVRGSGTQLRVELVESKFKNFNIGTIQIGSTSKKTLEIVNKSLAPVQFNILLEPKSEYLIKDRTALQLTSKTQNVSLAPDEIYQLQLKFASKQRIPKFTEEIFIEYSGINIPLCTISGACHGHSIWLDSLVVPFGAVYQKCSATKRLVMHNDGDIGASFTWDEEKLKPEFSIHPISGYISPGMDVNFDVTFSPNQPAPDIRRENVSCFLEGTAALKLKLAGSCVQVVPQKEVHHFETFVRQTEKKQLNLNNRTNMPWDIKPVIDGDYFSGAESFTVEPQSSYSYEVVYQPMTMTLDGKKHAGSIFFPLPDGTGIFYNLTGTSNPPKPSGKKLNIQVPCKTQFVEVLMVKNWLKKPQRFKVTFETMRTERGAVDLVSTSVKGHEYIDVPGNGEKEYRVNFFAHKEGLTPVKIVFKNEQTNEYCFYELSFKAERATSLGTIDLITQVRIPVSYSLKLDNPLQNNVTFNATCSNSTEVLIPPSLSITGKGQGEFNFEFLPLKAGETTHKLELNSSDLGVCVYDLNLKATPPAPERPLYFKTTLGNSQIVVAKFINFCRQKTDYSCKIDSPDFKIDKSIAAAPSQNPSGIEVSFDVTYEPSNLADVRANLYLSSSIGGEYVFPLIGTCLPPKPQGPYVVKSGGSTSISFKNVFNAPANFTFAIDNPLFHVTKTTESIKSHQVHKIIVGFDGNDSANKSDVMAKLIVTAPKTSGVSNNIQWIYYLRGVV